MSEEEVGMVAIERDILLLDSYFLPFFNSCLFAFAESKNKKEREEESKCLKRFLVFFKKSEKR
ncbi:hypothetical protein [Bacillus sp. FJAT-53711]|uniref:hypothetical protein n=1 Tax=Bacillus yunxiaonensis TaxID=3127665 RepID=UPI0030137A6C